nr:uncharacterized protein LOC112067798 [Salvelinus alpinus]
MATAVPVDSGLTAPTDIRTLFWRRALQRGSSASRKMASPEMPGSSQSMKKTIGHRGVETNTGETTYKKTTSSALKGAIQLGITHTVGSLSQKAERDVLMQDFVVVESIFFPRFPVLSPLTQFLSLPRLCPHQSHLHTISGLSGLSGPRHGYCCSRCAQKKWPPILLGPLKPPQSLLLSPLDLQSLQKTPLLPPVDTHHSTTKISQTPRAGSGLLPEGKWRMLGEVTRSVGRFQVAQIQEQRPGSMEMTLRPEFSDSDSVEDASLLGGNKSSSSSSSSAARGTQEVPVTSFSLADSLVFHFIFTTSLLLLSSPLNMLILGVNS